MTMSKESSPINASRGRSSFTLVFAEDRSDRDTVLMRLSFESGEIYEECMSRKAADLKSKTLVGDEFDTRLHEIVSADKGG